MCQKTGTVPCRWQGHPGSLIKRAVSALLISRQINKFGSFRNTWRLWHARCISMTVRHLPWLEYKPRTDHRICDRSSRGDAAGSFFQIEAWMPSEIKAISPLVDRLMRLIEGSHCVAGEEPAVELALEEALNNAVVHGNRMDGHKLIQVLCRCESGKGVSIVVKDQGQGI